MAQESFPPAEYEKWMTLVRKELGDKPFESLLRTDDNDITTEPLYSGDHTGLEESGDSSLYIRKSPRPVEIRQDIGPGDPKDLNRQALEALNGGVNSLGIVCPAEDLWVVLQGVIPDIISIHLDGDDPRKLLDTYVEGLRSRGLDPKHVRGSVAINDPSCFSGDTGPGFQQLIIDADTVGNLGGTAVHQLAYALAQGVEYMNGLTDHGLSADDAAPLLRFQFTSPADYLTGISMIRAFRRLWSQVIAAWKPVHECTHEAWVEVSTSAWELSAEDVYSNLLRATTQAMSAMTGGADTLAVLPCDHWREQRDPSSARWARNIVHLLVEEGGMAGVTDPGKGSYTIEFLTEQLCQKTWDLFLILDESDGDLLDAIMSYVNEVANEKKQALQEKKIVRIGVNKYPNQLKNPNERSANPVSGIRLTAEADNKH